MNASMNENAVQKTPPVSADDNREAVLAMAYARLRSHASWFYWIAGLTIVNLVMVMMQSDYFMVAGLGLNYAIPELLGMENERYLMACYGLTGAGVVLFGLFGWLAGRGNLAAFAIGISLYALDTPVFVTKYFSVMGMAIHGLALWSLVSGAILAWKLKAAVASPEPEPA